MAADVFIVIIDPTTGAVVAERWLGGNGVRDRVREVLQRAPDHERTGFLAWGGVTVPESRSISEAHYADGLMPIEVERLAAELPADRFWWAIWIDS